MVLDLIAIFRARHDPRLAARLAARFAQDQAFERMTAPLSVAHIGLWLSIIICILIIIALLSAAVALHWSIAILALVPIIIGGIALRLERGLRAGMARVRETANRLTDSGMDRILPNPPVRQVESACESPSADERSQD